MNDKTKLGYQYQMNSVSLSLFFLPLSLFLVLPVYMCMRKTSNFHNHRFDVRREKKLTQFGIHKKVLDLILLLLLCICTVHSIHTSKAWFSENKRINVEKRMAAAIAQLPLSLPTKAFYLLYFLALRRVCCFRFCFGLWGKKQPTNGEKIKAISNLVLRLVFREVSRFFFSLLLLLSQTKTLSARERGRGRWKTTRRTTKDEYKYWDFLYETT